MDLTFSEQETAFRGELRGWLAENPPAPEPSEGGEDEGREGTHFFWRRDWQRRLYDAGWAAPSWPTEYGGRGASLTESAIYFEELGRARVPMAANVLGLLLGGPTLMVWGTQEQKERYLAPILSAEEIWCQGFSEPDAGSDLAALKTRAVKDGEEWVVTGQKVWTSGAQYSKWCMLVARTDGEVAKHKGLTYFLMDMEQDAVQVRPLRQITGEAEFNELFIEEARIPDANVVGGVGNGWKVALTTLMNERAGLGFALQIRLRQLLDDLIAIAAERGLLEDALYADALAELHVRCESIRLLAWKGLTDVEKYGQPGPEGSLVKWLWSDTNQRLTDQSEIQRTARDLLAERAKPERVREHAEAGRTDSELWSELSALGWPGIAISERYGGQGLSQIELSILCEELGRSLAPVPFLGSAMAATVIEQDGSPKQRERWLPGLASGETIGALGASVEGTAELVIGGAEADLIVLIEPDGSGRVMSSEQAQVNPLASIDPTRSAARVNAAKDAGEALGQGACAGLGRALVSVSSELVGVCDRALAMTVAYVKDRKQFGVAVGAYQAVSHRCAQMLLETEKARSTAAFAAWTADSDPERLAEAAAMAKVAASDAGREVTASAIQAHGGIGFTWEADVHWLYKRAQLDAALLGGAKSHRARLAAILARRAGSPVG